MDKQTQIELEAAAFRKLLTHLDENKDVQNIDLMITGNFCRNCLSKWLVTEAKGRDVKLDMDDAKEWVYKMPYSEWKEKHQLPATEEQMTAFNTRQK